MDIATITKLIDAGYTKEDITAMEQPKDAPKDESKDAPKDETKKQETPAKEEPKGAPEHDNGILEAITQLTGTVTALQETVKAMQDANIKGAKTAKKSSNTVDDVLKSFTDKL